VLSNEPLINLSDFVLRELNYTLRLLHRWLLLLLLVLVLVLVATHVRGRLHRVAELRRRGQVIGREDAVRRRRHELVGADWVAVRRWTHRFRVLCKKGKKSIILRKI
jgi:hypothetical protein